MFTTTPAAQNDEHETGTSVKVMKGFAFSYGALVHVRQLSYTTVTWTNLGSRAHILIDIRYIT